MYLSACGLILAVVLALNWKDVRTLTLSAVVGLSIYLPAPDLFTQFYIFCTCAEIAVALVAFKLNVQASPVIIELCALLVIAHIMGYSLDGSQPFSPYQSIVKILELSQLTACAALSPILAPILRNKNVKTK